jgi:hypothetical protein
MKSFWARLVYVLLFIPVGLWDVVFWVIGGRAYIGLDLLDQKLKEWK